MGGGAGYLLFTALYEPKLSGAKPPKPARAWYQTKIEAETAKSLFKQRYPSCDGVACIVEAGVLGHAKQNGKRR
jgi:hypothetical protein